MKRNLLVLILLITAAATGADKSALPPGSSGNANLPLPARKVPSAGPAMKGKAGTAAGRSTNVEPTKILFSGDGPAFPPSLRLLAQVSNC